MTTSAFAGAQPDLPGRADVAPPSGLTRWERPEGGSVEAERALFEQLGKRIMLVQLKNKKKAKAPNVARAFHAKTVLGVENARLRVLDDLPADLRAGFVQPGAEYPATVRLSNASGTPQADHAGDMRGIALRVRVAPDEQHDLLATNYPVSHARDAKQFVAFAEAMAGNRALGIVRLAFEVGPGEVQRMLHNVRQATGHEVRSLALETYWSRGAILWGPAGPVRYLLRHAVGSPPAPEPVAADPEYLRHELQHRLAQGDVVFDLLVQRFVDEQQTPIEDGAVEWTETVSPPIPVAQLTIPKQDVGTAQAVATEARVDQVAFSPWHTTPEFHPLGNLNRARKAVYLASSGHRLGYRFAEKVPLRNRVLGGLNERLFRAVDRFREWHKLPLTFQLLNLSAFRDELRRWNLIDTEYREAPPQAGPVEPPVPESVRTARTYDGTYNDLSDPKMGAIGSTFGRNMPPVYRPDLLNEPNPVVVSRELLARRSFIPARSLNILAATWIQFQVHDWVNHARLKLGQRDVEVPMPPGETWRSSVDGPAETVMRIAGNEWARDPDPGRGLPPVYFGDVASHWWDGSEVYGPDVDRAKLLREDNGRGAKLNLPNGYLPDDVNGVAVTGFNESWWLGLSSMHTLFAREHNAVCDALKAEYPHWSEDRIYHTARLVVSALIAKIHTVEWTPAILATKAIDIGLNGNWSGPKGWTTRAGLWLIDAHALKGIPQTLPDHHTAPYSLTEDFVTVYRMHPLIPDDYRFLDGITGDLKETRSFGDIQGVRTDDEMRRLGLRDVLYSFGIANPGAITLHNFPEALRSFRRDGEIIDLSVVDLVRTRRRGVPRYNGFRAGLRKPPITRWEDLTADPEDVRLLKDVYRDIDNVDTVVGLLGETPPEGFGFSDTAFRIFILMASRRLQSDRFLTVDFRPEIYSPLGMDWIERNGMTSVILRHCPELAGVVPRTQSAFAPWRAIAGA